MSASAAASVDAYSSGHNSVSMPSTPAEHALSLHASQADPGPDPEVVIVQTTSKESVPAPQIVARGKSGSKRSGRTKHRRRGRGKKKSKTAARAAHPATRGASLESAASGGVPGLDFAAGSDDDHGPSPMLPSLLHRPATSDGLVDGSLGSLRGDSLASYHGVASPSRNAMPGSRSWSDFQSNSPLSSAMLGLPSASAATLPTRVSSPRLIIAEARRMERTRAGNPRRRRRLAQAQREQGWNNRNPVGSGIVPE